MAADDLCALAEVREALLIPAGDTTDDARISSGIEYVTAAIKSYVERDVLYNPGSATITTEYRDGQGSEELHTAEWPIISVTSLHDDVDRDYGASTLLTENTDFLVYGAEGRIMRISESPHDVKKGWGGAIFANGQQNLKVVYVAGYTAIPTDLKRLTIGETVAWLNRTPGEGTIRTSKGQVSEDYQYGFSLDARAILAKYRRLAPLFT